MELFLRSGYEDLGVVLQLTDSDLAQMGVSKIGHRKKLRKYMRLCTAQRVVSEAVMTEPMEQAQEAILAPVISEPAPLRPLKPPRISRESQQRIQDWQNAQARGSPPASPPLMAVVPCDPSTPTSSRAGARKINWGRKRNKNANR